MTYTIVGLFSSQNQSKAISESLESYGFKNSDYIIYVPEIKKAEKTSFWKRLFSKKIKEENTMVDSLIISIGIENNQQLENVKKVFKENQVVNTYELNDIPFHDAKNLDYIKKVVALKAKMLIYAMPEIKTSHTEIHTGINTELNVGK